MRRIMCPSTSSMSCKDEVEIRRKVIDKPMGPFESFHALHCISTLPALTGRQWRVLKIVGKRYYNIDFGGLIAHISDW